MKVIADSPLFLSASNTKKYSKSGKDFHAWCLRSDMSLRLEIFHSPEKVF